MDWIHSFNKCIDHIEDNLCNKIEIEELAQIAYSSKFHFQRMFSMIAGLTLKEYIRKRRLTLAAQELASSNCKVIDIAFKYSYSTPESFSKAFTKVHGISPSSVKHNTNINLCTYPRLSFQIQIKGAEKMNYKIIEKGSFDIIGKSIDVSTKDEKNFKRIPAFWQESCDNGLIKEFLGKAGELGVFGVCADYDAEQETCTYLIAIEKTTLDTDHALVTRKIPASTWVVFESMGPIPESIQENWKRIYSEWFPSTGYEHAGTEELEIYPPGNPSAPDYRCEIWIPIVKK